MSEAAWSRPPRSPLAARVLDRINEARAAAGLTPLEVSPPLDDAALEHAADMARRSFFSYASPDGVEVWARARRCGYQGPVGVSLLMGQPDPDEAVVDWLGDDTSRGSILDPSYRHMGVGMVDGRWTLILGAGRSATASSAASIPQPAPSQPPGRAELAGTSYDRLVAIGPPQEATPELRQRVLDLLNHHRDLARLTLGVAAPQLEQAAQLHAIDMAKRDFFNYASADGHSVLDRVKQAGYTGRALPAIAQGIDSPDLLCEALLRSEGHRQHILDPDVRHFGVGMMRGRWTIICGVPTVDASQPLVQATLTALNIQRQLVAAPLLVLSEQLGQAAQAHAMDMASRAYFDFSNPRGGGVDMQVKLAGYRGRTVAAITRGQNTPEAALEAWRKSAGNWENLMNPRFTQLGVGVSASHWTLVLGIPQ